MRTLGAVMLASTLLVSAVQPQDRNEFQNISPRYVDIAEAKQLVEMLKTATETPIGFENYDRAPLTITEASVKTVKRRRSNLSTSASIQGDEYVMEERVALINNTDRRTKVVALRFTDINERKKTDLSAWATVEPYGSFVFGQGKRTGIESLPVDPSRFTVTLLVVRWEDGTLWERYPSYVEQTDVDTEPRPLRTPQATYTEEAQRHKIRGFVHMRVLVGADGEVKQVRITAGLPDGLNEEAVKEAYNLKFNPAMKDGRPVERWLTFEIDFGPRESIEHGRAKR